MARNLQSQLQHCVSASFYGCEGTDTKGGFGVSKHSDKISGQKAGKIYSHETYKNRRDVAKEFGKFMKQNFPDVKKVKDITKDHATAFVEKKSSEVSTNTLNNIRSQLKGLGDNINHTFKSCNVDLSTQARNGITAEKVKDVHMTNNDYKTLIQSYNDPMKSNAAVGAQVIWASGLRAHEVCALKGSDITINKDGTANVYVAQGKGGRERDVVVSDPSRVQTLQDIKNNFGDERVCPIKPNSLEVNISRHLKQSDTERDYKYNSCHSIRKCYAQDTYDRLKSQGHDSEKAWGQVCQNLGHSADRTALFKTYIEKA